MRVKVFERNLLRNFQRCGVQTHVGVHCVQPFQIEVVVRKHFARRQLRRGCLGRCRRALRNWRRSCRTRSRPQAYQRPEVGQIEAAAFQRRRQQRFRLAPLVTPVAGEISVADHTAEARVGIHIAFAHQPASDAIRRRIRQCQRQGRIQSRQAGATDRHLRVDAAQAADVAHLALGADRRPPQTHLESNRKRLARLTQREDVTGVCDAFERTAAPTPAKCHSRFVAPLDTAHTTGVDLDVLQRIAHRKARIVQRKGLHVDGARRRLIGLAQLPIRAPVFVAH